MKLSYRRCWFRVDLRDGALRKPAASRSRIAQAPGKHLSALLSPFLKRRYAMRSILRSLLGSVLVALVALAPAGSALADPLNRFVVFGDSLSDPGNAFVLLNTVT